MRLFLIALFYIVSFTLNAQTKYLIYLTDKGPEAKRLNKSSGLYWQAVESLSSRSIERRKLVMGENFITYEDLPIHREYVDTIESLGIKVIHKLKWFNAVSAYLNPAEVERIKELPFVKKLEVVRSFKERREIGGSLQIIKPEGLAKSNHLLDYGPSFAQNNLSEIPVVHNLGIKGTGVIVGLLDTGFRWKTTGAIQKIKLIAERDFIQNDYYTGNEGNDTPNQDSHGTSVLSIIGGYAPGYLIGPAYDASYLLAKTEFVPTETHVEEDNYAAAMEWMDEQGADITSSSLGYREFDTGQFSYTYQDMNGNTTIVARAANFAFERGISTFTSAGNEGMNLISSPGDAFEILTVGAVTPANMIASFSSRGPTSDGRIKPEIVAQGTSVVNAWAGTASSYNSGSGTSFSAPIAAGIAALLKSAYPHLTNRQIRQIFLECGDNTTTPNNEVGYGLISARKAIGYPNLRLYNGVFTLNKIFIVDGGFETASVKLFLKKGDGSFQEYLMNYDGSLKFTYQLEQLAGNESVEFYFTLQANNGQLIREPSSTYYKLKYGRLEIDNVLTDVEDETGLPAPYSLLQNYPNPFNPATKIKFLIPEPSFVSLKVYDMLGREVAVLVYEMKNPGIYVTEFNADNLSIASGVYFYRLTAIPTAQENRSAQQRNGHASNYTETRKMVFTK